MSKRTKREYGLLARFYETLTPYAPAMNAHARRKALGRHLDEARTVCDLGCGPGASALELAREGKSVFAVDLSAHFCELVRARARAERLDVAVVHADMRAFRLPRRVDLVLAEFAAINNLDDRRGLARVFRSVARALEPGGRFLFDVNTPKSFATQIGRTDWIDTPEFKLAMHSRLDGHPLRARIECEWFVPERKLFRHVHESIVNAGWTDREIRDALLAAGLRPERTFDGVDVRPAMEGAVRGTDRYYVARKLRR